MSKALFKIWFMRAIFLVIGSLIAFSFTHYNWMKSDLERAHEELGKCKASYSAAIGETMEAKAKAEALKTAPLK